MSQTQTQEAKKVVYTTTREIMLVARTAFEDFCNEDAESVRNTAKRIGNNAAGIRARELSLLVRHLLKQYKALKINE